MHLYRVTCSIVVCCIALSGCAKQYKYKKKIDRSYYERANKASQKALQQLDKE